MRKQGLDALCDLSKAKSQVLGLEAKKAKSFLYSTAPTISTLYSFLYENGNNCFVWPLGWEHELISSDSCYCVQLFVIPWTVVHQTPLSTGFSRQEYWSGFPFPSPEDLPNSGVEPGSAALQADSLPSVLQGRHLYELKVTKVFATLHIPANVLENTVNINFRVINTLLIVGIH